MTFDTASLETTPIYVGREFWDGLIKKNIAVILAVILTISLLRIGLDNVKDIPPHLAKYYYYTSMATYEEYPAQYLRHHLPNVGMHKSFSICKGKYNFKLLMLEDHSTGELIAAIRGTDNLGNWLANLSHQFSDPEIIAEIAKGIKEIEAQTGKKVTTMVGHSAACRLISDYDPENEIIFRITFNGHQPVRGARNINLCLNGDPVSGALSVSGRNIYVGNGGKNPIAAHRMKHFKKCFKDNPNWHDLSPSHFGEDPNASSRALNFRLKAEKNTRGDLRFLNGVLNDFRQGRCSFNDALGALDDKYQTLLKRKHERHEIPKKNSNYISCKEWDKRLGALRIEMAAIKDEQEKFNHLSALIDSGSTREAYAFAADIQSAGSKNNELNSFVSFFMQSYEKGQRLAQLNHYLNENDLDVVFDLANELINDYPNDMNLVQECQEIRAAIEEHRICAAIDELNACLKENKLKEVYQLAIKLKKDYPNRKELVKNCEEIIRYCDNMKKLKEKVAHLDEELAKNNIAKALDIARELRQRYASDPLVYEYCNQVIKKQYLAENAHYQCVLSAGLRLFSNYASRFRDVSYQRLINGISSAHQIAPYAGAYLLQLPGAFLQEELNPWGMAFSDSAAEQLQTIRNPFKSLNDFSTNVNFYYALLSLTPLAQHFRHEMQALGTGVNYFNKSTQAYRAYQYLKSPKHLAQFQTFFIDLAVDGTFGILSYSDAAESPDFYAAQNWVKVLAGGALFLTPVPAAGIGTYFLTSSLYAAWCTLSGNDLESSYIALQERANACYENGQIDKADEKVKKLKDSLRSLKYRASDSHVVTASKAYLLIYQARRDFDEKKYEAVLETTKFSLTDKTSTDKKMPIRHIPNAMLLRLQAYCASPEYLAKSAKQFVDEFNIIFDEISANKDLPKKAIEEFKKNLHGIGVLAINQLVVLGWHATLKGDMKLTLNILASVKAGLRGFTQWDHKLAPMSRYYIGSLFLQTGEPKEAITQFDRVLKKDRDAFFWYEYAQALIQLKKFLELNKDHLEANIMLIVCFENCQSLIAASPELYKEQTQFVSSITEALESLKASMPNMNTEQKRLHTRLKREDRFLPRISKLLHSQRQACVYHGEVISFNQRIVPTGGDGFLRALGVTRNTAVAMLLRHKDNSLIRAMVGVDIRAMFLAGCLPEEMQELKEFKELVKEIGRKPRSKRNLIQKYANSKEVFEAFVKFHVARAGSQLNFNLQDKLKASTLDAIAKLAGKNICVWRRSRTDIPLLVNVVAREYDKSNETIHLFHTNWEEPQSTCRQNHFNLLKSSDSPWSSMKEAMLLESRSVRMQCNINGVLTRIGTILTRELNSKPIEEQQDILLGWHEKQSKAADFRKTITNVIELQLVAEYGYLPKLTEDQSILTYLSSLQCPILHRDLSNLVTVILWYNSDEIQHKRQAAITHMKMLATKAYQTKPSDYSTFYDKLRQEFKAFLQFDFYAKRLLSIGEKYSGKNENRLMAITHIISLVNNYYQQFSEGKPAEDCRRELNAAV